MALLLTGYPKSAACKVAAIVAEIGVNIVQRLFFLAIVIKIPKLVAEPLNTVVPTPRQKPILQFLALSFERESSSFFN